MSDDETTNDEQIDSLTLSTGMLHCKWIESSNYIQGRYDHRRSSCDAGAQLQIICTYTVGAKQQMLIFNATYDSSL